MKKSLAFLMGLTVVASALTGCGAKSSSESKESATSATEATTAADTTEATTAAETTTEAAEEDEEENYDTGDASLDNPRNQDEIGENELLVLSFGTSFNDSRRLTIGAIEDALEKAFPDYSVRRGFTANIIIDHVKRRDNEVIDDVKEALDRAQKNGVKTLVVQPTHLMDGLEYNDIVNEIASYSDAFDKVVIGKPLLTTDDDFKRVENAIVDWTKDYDDGKTAICFMGHGTEAESNSVYAKMQDMLTADGHTNYFVGTVEASPSVEDVLKKVKEGGYEKVVLEPLMVVAGDHANNDMAGEDEDSWLSLFNASGKFDEIKTQISGLGRIEEIQKLYVEHTKNVLK